MEEKVIKNVIDYKYADFEIGDKIKFGNWANYVNSDAVWTVLKKVDFSNLSEDDNKCLNKMLGNAKNQYDGKALIIKIHDHSKLYYGTDFIKDEKLRNGCYLNFHFYNEWFDKENFPIGLNKNEEELILKNESNNGFYLYDGDVSWKGTSNYLGKDLLLEEYDNNYAILVNVGEGDDNDLEDWGYGDGDGYVHEIKKYGMYKYKEDDIYFNFKTNSAMTTNRNGAAEERTAFSTIFEYSSGELLDLMENLDEDENDFLSGDERINVISLVVIKVKD